MYKLKKEESGLITVEKDKIVEAKGFGDEESALHCIWVLEGRKKDSFYSADKEGNVREIERDSL